MKCYNCQTEGHIRSQCPYRRELAAVPDLPEQGNVIPLPVTRRRPDPPAESYLQAKAELGMPRRPDIAAILTAHCPWCDAGPWQPCVNRATETAKADPHEARYLAAGVEPPRRPALADVARRQADEAKAERERIILR